MDDFLEDHLAGKHEAEISALMEAMEPCFEGHSRAVIFFALERSIAAMLDRPSPRHERK